MNLKLGDWVIPETPGVDPQVGDEESVEILGDTYTKKVMPDGKWWTTKNLVYTGAGGSWWGGGASDDGDGRYYTYAQCLAIHTLLGDGWRVPKETDSDDFYNALNAIHPGQEAKVIKSTGTTWWNASAGHEGTDLYGFGMHGTGYQATSTLWYSKKSFGRFWVRYTTAPSATGFYIGADYDKDVLRPRNVTTSDRIPIRLVQDVSPSPPIPAIYGYHDILLESDNAVLVSDLAQRVDIRLRTFLGEHWLNPEIGVPYFTEFLKKSPDLAVCRQALLAVIQGVPGVVEVQRLTLTLSPLTRTLAVDFTVTGTDSIPSSGLTAVPL